MYWRLGNGLSDRLSNPYMPSCLSSRLGNCISHTLHLERCCNRVSSRSCVRCCGNGVSTRLSYSARVCQRLPDQAGELVAEYLLYQQPYLSHLCVSGYCWARRLIALVCG